jgi:hypothetical protein
MLFDVNKSTEYGYGVVVGLLNFGFVKNTQQFRKWPKPKTAGTASRLGSGVTLVQYWSIPLFPQAPSTPTLFYSHPKHFWSNIAKIYKSSRKYQSSTPIFKIINKHWYRKLTSETHCSHWSSSSNSTINLISAMKTKTYLSPLDILKIIDVDII